MNRCVTCALVAATSLLLGCPPERPTVTSEVEVRTGVSKAPVAKIGTEEITLREYKDRIDRLPEYVRPRLATVESRAQHLDALVDFELLADEAERRGYGDDPRVIHAVKEELARRAVEDGDREAILEEARENSKVDVDVGKIEKALRAGKDDE